MQVTSVIRNRGQLTIPDSIRKLVGWAGTMSAVTIMVNRQDEILIRPKTKAVDMEELWKRINEVRNLRAGESFDSLDFIQKDRQSH